MAVPGNPLAALDARRVALGMTIDAVSKRCGASSSTVERVLSGRYGAASFETVQQIAAVLGAELRLEANADIAAIREAQATRKARQLVAAGLEAKPSQDTAGSAGATVDEAAQHALVQRWIHKLLAGSNRKLWS